MRTGEMTMALLLSMVCWINLPTALRVQAPGAQTWKSFELIYYDPSAKPNMLSPFNADPKSEFTTEMSIRYLRRYANELLARTGKKDPRYLAFNVVTAEEARSRALKIKEKPSTAIRRVIPLTYWRWKMEAHSQELVRDLSWVARKFVAESVWNELEAP